MYKRLEYQIVGGISIALGVMQAMINFPSLILTFNGLLLVVLGATIAIHKNR